jgi:transposase-like protein/DNA-binding XRE family transcriptional regulator
VKQKQYSESFKQRMIQRMVGRGRVSANALSKEVGVAQPTLSLWLKAAGRVSVVSDDKKPKGKRPEDWTSQKKLAAVLEAARLSDSELGGWLRHEGLTEEHLRQWREALEEVSEKRLAEIDAAVAEDVRTFRELREALGITQTELATRAEMTQSEVSKFETRDDHRIERMREMVEALGGTLEVIAVVGDKRVRMA